jgi:hypothetical protein
MNKQRITKQLEEEKGLNTKHKPRPQQPSQDRFPEILPTSHFHSSLGLYLQPYGPPPNALYPNPLLPQLPFLPSNILAGTSSYSGAQLPVMIGDNFCRVLRCKHFTTSNNFACLSRRVSSRTSLGT